MKWLSQLNEKFKSGASHAFLLYLNVADDFLKADGEFEQLRYCLANSPPLNDFHFVAFFNRGTGVNFPSEELEMKFKEFLDCMNICPGLQGVKSSEVFEHKRTDISFVLKIFSKLMLYHKNYPSKSFREWLNGFEKENGAKQSFFGVIIEFAETKVPPAASYERDSDRDALVVFLDWARNQKIQEAGNLIIFTTEALNAVAPAMRSEINRISPIKISFPDLQERGRIIEKLGKGCPEFTQEIPVDLFAHLSSGMTNHNLVQLSREVAYNKKPLHEDQIFAIKKKCLEEQSGGLLEILKPSWGIQAIGALHEIKKFIVEVSEAFRNKDTMAVPMGILLLGDRGTGKTVVVQALAHEIGIPIIKPKNLREMWHGNSERNQELVLELAIAYEPAIFFFDEIDQQFQMRGTVFHGDSGISARMQARFFDVTSDTDLRGKLLWMAASNRPDLIDPALIREGRFDEKIPFFPPEAHERSEILLAILHKMQVQAKESRKPFAWDLSKSFVEEFGWLTHRHNKKDEGLTRCASKELHSSETEIGLTGAEIEVIIRKAHALASREGGIIKNYHLIAAEKDFILSRDVAESERLTELAVVHCNSKRFIPEGKWRRRLATLSQNQRIVSPGHYL